MNREQKAAAIEEIAANIRESEAVFAVDYRGLSVPQAGELRTRLRAADARFSVVKNTLTERAADAADAEALKELLNGPTALAFVRGDAAAAAKALRDYGRETELLPFKGGLMNGAALTPEDIGNIARLPSREVLYGQLVGVIAHPISGLARTLNALIGGLAIALGQVRDLDPPALAGQGAPAPAAEATAAEAPASEAADPEPADAAPTEAAVEPTDADDGTVDAPEGGEVAAGEAEDADAGPASTPEAPQPDQAEGADTPEETS
jgi:large subunit ribosomal protein L10